MTAAQPRPSHRFARRAALTGTIGAAFSTNALRSTPALSTTVLYSQRPPTETRKREQNDVPNCGDLRKRGEKRRKDACEETR
jgi:hypothetical protein